MANKTMGKKATSVSNRLRQPDVGMGVGSLGKLFI
jgi:hypothetical protein